jgi:hypothetical protein
MRAKIVNIGIVFISIIGIMSVVGHLLGITPPPGIVTAPGPEWFGE